MSIGASGRVVVEIDPTLKRELYSILARKGVTLKDWFVGRIDECIAAETLEVSGRAKSSRLRKGRQDADR